MACSEPEQVVPSRPDLPADDAVRLLGPVELIGPDGPVPLTEPAARLLGLLALRAGEVVSDDDLRRTRTDRLGSAEHAAGRQEVAAALATAGIPGALQTHATGLCLAIPAQRVDVGSFIGLVARGRCRMAAGEWAEAADLFAAALRRWRAPVGQPPLTGFPLSGWAAVEVNRLVATRMATIEARWRCVLRLAAAGHVAAGAPVVNQAAVAAGVPASHLVVAAIGELEQALRAEPHRPELWELLLVATFLGAGRRAAEQVADRAADDPARQPAEVLGQRLTDLMRAACRGDLIEKWLATADGEPSRPPTGTAAAWRPPLRPIPPPMPLTPLLGRDELLAAVTSRLADARLVTLTGAAGAGKTRLAVAAAHRWRAGPVWYVDLAAVESPVRVPQAVAAALGVRDEPGQDSIDTLAEVLDGDDGLLLLDNCEHLVAGCAELTSRLLARCAGLRVLTTSRRALRVPAEVVLTVPPLAVPPRGRDHTVARLATHAASRLFLERARACSSRPVPEASAGAVAELCAELDGLPLAIELAAARTATLDVGDVVARIRADLRLLRTSDPTAPARHRTLTAALESSVEQLDPAARALFDRLAVVPGAVDAAMARALAGPDAAAALDALADASLLEPVAPSDVESTTGGARFRMLVPIRRYAQNRLAACGGENAARRDFAGYCLAQAERAEPELVGARQEAWLRRLRADGPNLRAAMTWLAEAGAAGPRYGDLRMAVALARYHRLVGSYREGQSWLAGALARHPAAPAPLRARGGTAAAMLALLLCEYSAATEHAEAAWLACQASGDRPGQARVEMILGSVARERGRYAESAAHLATASAIFAECGDEVGEAQTVQLRGFTAWLAGDLERASFRLRASLRWWDRLGDPRAGASALMSLGAVALYRGDVARAEVLLATALRRCAKLDYPEGAGWVHNLCGLVALRLGRTDRAADHLTRSLALHRQVGDRWRTASVLEALAEVARRQGAPRRAAGLLGAASKIRTDIGTPVPACERPDTEATLVALRAELGADGFTEAYRAGSGALLDTLLDDAGLVGSSAPSTRPWRSASPVIYATASTASPAPPAAATEGVPAPGHGRR